MKVKLHDDKKEKAQSFEANIAFETDAAHIHQNVFDYRSYGATKEDAIKGLKERVEFFIKNLQNIDFDNIEMVDCSGNPL